MENAAKALVIAGAILISILLISVGIMVMNSTGDVQEQMERQMSSSAVQSFNSQFSAYAGPNRSASQIRSLDQVVKASNASNSDHKIYIYKGSVEEANKMTATNIAELTSKDRFTVSVDDKDEDGYYDAVIITGGSITSAAPSPAAT